jgi:hypothetical protein
MSLKAKIQETFGEPEAQGSGESPVKPQPYRPGRGTGYARTALEAEVALLAAAREPGRNAQLNRSAFALGQLVAGGELSEAEVVQRLTQTAKEIGLTDKEIPNTIRSGLRGGAKSPRTAPPRNHSASPPPLPPDDDFWTARAPLGTIRDAARDRLVSPWATLGAVLAHVCSRIGPHVVLPPIVGSIASLNLFVALVGPSGAGKDAALGLARDLLWLDDQVPTHEVGTGQGIDSSYTTQTKNGPVQFCDAALFTITEIDSLAGHARMQGSTILATLRKVYSGSALGARYADKERRRPVRAHRYRAALVGGVQPARSGVLLNDADGGTPQRWLWLPTNDPGGRGAATEPFRAPRGALWQQFEYLQAYGEVGDDAPVPQRRQVELKVCETARTNIVEHRRRRLDAPLVGGEDIDGHVLLTRLKVAAVLALFDGRVEVTDEDWHLAGIVMAVSHATRGVCEQALTEQRSRANRARAADEIERTELVAEHTTQRVAATVLRVLRRRGDWMPRAELRRSLPGRDREHFESAVERLRGAGQIDEEESNRGTKYRCSGE